MLTPGVRVSRSSNFRPRIGVVLTVVSLSVLLTSVRVMSIWAVPGHRDRLGGPDTFNTGLRLMDCPTVRMTSSCTCVAKPCKLTVTV